MAGIYRTARGTEERRGRTTGSISASGGGIPRKGTGMKIPRTQRQRLWNVEKTPEREGIPVVRFRMARVWEGERGLSARSVGRVDLGSASHGPGWPVKHQIDGYLLISGWVVSASCFVRVRRCAGRENEDCTDRKQVERDRFGLRSMMAKDKASSADISFISD